MYKAFCFYFKIALNIIKLSEKQPASDPHHVCLCGLENVEHDGIFSHEMLLSNYGMK